MKIKHCELAEGQDCGAAIGVRVRELHGKLCACISYDDGDAGQMVIKLFKEIVYLRALVSRLEKYNKEVIEGGVYLLKKINSMEVKDSVSP